MWAAVTLPPGITARVCPARYQIAGCERVSCRLLRRMLCKVETGEIETEEGELRQKDPALDSSSPTHQTCQRILLARF